MRDEVNLSPAQVQDRDPGVQLLDVRQPWEFARASLPGAILIPLGELAGRLGELDPARPVIAYCHHGARSYQAVRFLAQSGFARAAHLAGGIAAYSLMDPTIPQY
jgi:sulfur-carrier protein adenylyltransferase/sulfurtransferase